ncbi:MAG: succinyl-diaminopimelate desuccinylase, partial [Rhabdaerophilum sp.]
MSRAAALTRDLVRCASVTPEEGGALALIEAVLKPYGFDVQRPVFSEAGTADVENLHARLGTEGPVLVFAGHTDVVPTGDVSAWS